jgi:YD repeat-containing protein
MRFVASYHQREPNQPQTFSYSNLGRLWTFGWLSFVEDDPASPSASAKVYLRGSGAEVFIGYDASSQSYASDPDSHAVLVRTSSSPIRYERRHADGSVDVFSLSDGAVVSPRRVFMTSFKDPQGNTVTLTWDGSFRIVAATDALGQVTTLSYEDAANPLRITKVTDPFGRFARFDYNGLGQLVRITDVIGIQSEFSYDTGDFIKALTTPYGTTTFTHGGSDYWVEAKDPLGGRERIHYLPFAPIPQSEPVAPTGVELYNLELANFNTFYWDKRAMALHPGEHTVSEPPNAATSERLKSGHLG